MPAFGKSGTCLMCCFRSMRALESHAIDGERRVGSGWFFRIHEHLADARPGRSGSQRTLDAGHRLDVAFNQRFDTTVGQIANPSCHALPKGNVACEEAEADTLHATTHQKPPSHA